MIDFAKLPRRKTADVAVIGGGTAGVFAAISAARAGARTILVEKNGMLGGTVTVANVDFPGLFFAWGKQIVDGPCWEAIKRAEALGGAEIPAITYKPERHWHEQVTLNRFIYTHVLNEMLKEAGVEVLCHAMISHAVETEAGLKLAVTDKQGLMGIDAGFAIDATGDANLVQMMGYPCEKSEVQQPATLQNRIGGYDPAVVDDEEVAALLAKEGDTLPVAMSAAKVRGTLNKHKIDVHTLCVDADTSEGKTRLEQKAVAEMMQICSFLRKIKGLENLTVEFAAEETGVRETNRILGETVITAEEYVAGADYPDAVCYSFYPIDLHVERGIEQKQLEEGVVPKVPYRALIPKGAGRLLCVGRSISSDTYANSALRTQATCMATGQAAGCAAAICAAEHKAVQDVDYGKLCAELTKQGAIVPR